jgi:hypothetical protein
MDVDSDYSIPSTDPEEFTSDEDEPIKPPPRALLGKVPRWGICKPSLDVDKVWRCRERSCTETIDLTRLTQSQREVLAKEWPEVVDFLGDPRGHWSWSDGWVQLTLMCLVHDHWKVHLDSEGIEVYSVAIRKGQTKVSLILGMKEHLNYPDTSRNGVTDRSLAKSGAGGWITGSLTVPPPALYHQRSESVTIIQASSHDLCVFSCTLACCDIFQLLVQMSCHSIIIYNFYMIFQSISSI